MIGEALTLIRVNWRSFLLFEIAYKIVGLCVVVPLLVGLVNVSMFVSGVAYLAPETISKVATCPITYLCAIVLIAIAVMYALVDVCACIVMCDMSHDGKIASVVAVTKFAVLRAFRVFSKGYRSFALVVALILPLAGVVLAPSFFGAFAVPDFIMTFIGYKVYYTVAFVVVALALFVLGVLVMYSLHYFVLEDCTFRVAVSKSKSLGSGHRVKDVLFCLLMQVAYAVVIGIILALLILALFGIGVLFQNSAFVLQVIEVALSAAGLLLAAAMLLVAYTCSTPFCYVCVSALYYRRRDARDEPARELYSRSSLEYRRTKGKRIAVGAVSLVVYAITAALVFGYYGGAGLSYRDDSASDVVVVAHRCGANYAPENTVAALNKAADMGVSWCEIDVQQCADNTIIVSHDTNFSRLAGVDLNSWDATFEQVDALDVGSSFGSEYTGEGIPLLSEMIEAAKARGMKLQIEIKPTGHDEGIEQRVVDIVREYGFQDDCLIASMNYGCLQKIRSCGSDVKTLYIMSLAFGDIASISEADAYSVESTWATSLLANNVHTKEGAVLCAWTVNSRLFIEAAIDNGVDQLVTDDIELAREIIEETQEDRNLLFDLAEALRKK